MVVAVAAALRLAALESQPGGLYPDEAAEGLDAHRLLHEPGFHPVFFHDDAGREALFGYLVALAFRGLGESATVLRGVAAVIGVLGIVALLTALRRLGAWVAIAGAAWAAGSLWLICVSRDGFRVILVPLAGALAVAALIRWGDHPGKRAAALAGAAVAAGLWTYQPLKLSPLLVVLWLAWIRRTDRRRFAELRLSFRWFAGAFAIVAAPMVWTAITDPGNYFGRGAAVTALNPDQGLAALPLHVLRTLGMVAFTGDPNPRHDVAGLPLLGVPLLALAVAGGWRAWRRRGDHAHALMLLGLPVFLLPPLIATEGGSPHFLRSLGLVPVVAAMVGLGTVEVVERYGQGRRARTGVAAAAMGTLLAAAGVGSAAAYFSRPVADRYDAYSFDVVAMAAEGRAPGAAVVIDDFSAFVVRFLDAGSAPAIVDPSSRIAAPRRYTRIVARTRNDLRHTAGAALAERASIAARDPAGQPTVWVVAP